MEEVSDNSDRLFSWLLMLLGGGESITGCGRVSFGERGWTSSSSIRFSSPANNKAVSKFQLQANKNTLRIGYSNEIVQVFGLEKLETVG